MAKHDVAVDRESLGSEPPCLKDLFRHKRIEAWRSLCMSCLGKAWSYIRCEYGRQHPTTWDGFLYDPGSRSVRFVLLFRPRWAAFTVDPSNKDNLVEPDNVVIFISLTPLVTSERYLTPYMAMSPLLTEILIASESQAVRSAPMNQFSGDIVDI